MRFVDEMFVGVMSECMFVLAMSCNWHFSVVYYQSTSVQQQLQTLMIPSQMPEAFICPITHEVFVDPVVAADGH